MSSPDNETVPENLKARLKGSYDAIAPVYNAWTKMHLELRLSQLDKLIQLLPLGDTGGSAPSRVTVLELGCGAGAPVIDKLLAHPSGSVHVTANDLSHTQIELGKERLGTERVTWIEGDMMELSFPDAAFDAVVGMYSLIHLPRAEQEVMLGRIARWLKPGGLVLLNFSAEAAKGMVMERWLDDKGWMFWSGWGSQGTLDKIKDAGLEVVESNVIGDDVDATFLWVVARLS